MNISQHAIIPLGYPSQYGYYNSSGTLVNNGSTSIYRSLKMSGTYGCNKFYRAVPQKVYNSYYYGNVRGWDNSSVEPVQSATVKLNVADKSVFDFNGSWDINSLMITMDTVYASIINYPFLIFFKDNTPVVTSLSFGNLLTPDIIDEEIL